MSVIEDLEEERARLRAALEANEADIARVMGSELRGSVPKPVSLAELLEEKGDFSWLVGGLIAHGSVSMLAAEPKIGKSYALTHLGLCLATGRQWLDCPIHEPAKVLYVMAEGARLAFRNRVAAACKTLGIDPRSANWFMQPADMHDFNLRKSNIGKMFERSKAKLIILDTKGYFDGFVDENDASKWKANVMAPLRSFIAQLGCAFIVVHHYGKAVPGKSRVERGRGTSAMMGDVDHWFGLERVEMTAGEQDRASCSAEVAAEYAARRDFFVELNRYGQQGTSTRLDFDPHGGVFWLAGQRPRVATAPEAPRQEPLWYQR